MGKFVHKICLWLCNSSHGFGSYVYHDLYLKNYYEYDEQNYEESHEMKYELTYAISVMTLAHNFIVTPIKKNMDIMNKGGIKPVKQRN